MIKYLKVKFIVILLIYMPVTMHAQNWQTSVSVDSRIGYSSNTYLNPFFSVWDSSVESGYGLFSVFGQGLWSRNRNTLEMTGGVIAEPLFNDSRVRRGGLGLLNYRRRLSPSLTLGMEAGASFFKGFNDSRTAWAQPYLTWFVSSYTSLRLKAGTYYQSYQNLTDSPDIRRRSDVFGLEFETWPGYHWQITSAFYTALDQLNSPREELRSNVSVGYLFLNGTKITATLGFDQYQFQFASDSDTGGPGNPPGGGPPQQTQISNGNDRLLRFGLTGRYPINKSLSIFTTLEGINRSISTQAKDVHDFNLSAGIRFSFQPKVGSAGRSFITPEWERQADDKMMLKINYSGGGRLYLVGDFNNWNRVGIPLIEQSKNTYSGAVPVSVGAYEYKILHREGSTEEWLSFSKHTYMVDDGFGGENAMLLVE